MTEQSDNSSSNTDADFSNLDSYQPEKTVAELYQEGVLRTDGAKQLASLEEAGRSAFIGEPLDS